MCNSSDNRIRIVTGSKEGVSTNPVNQVLKNPNKHITSEMRQQGSSSTEQNYRRIRNKFNGNGNGPVEMRKLQNGGLVYPVQPPKSAPLPRKMYPSGNGNSGSQNPGNAFDNHQTAMVSASSVNDLRFVQHQPHPRSGSRENGNLGPPAGMMQTLSFGVEMVSFLESLALFSKQGS